MCRSCGFLATPGVTPRPRVDHGTAAETGWDRMARVVRPEERRARPVKTGQGRRSCCIVPAGSSPVSVGAGVPSSRPQAAGEIQPAQAGCREPLRREQDRGPQHQANSAASTDSQRKSRAAHFTAKAMSDEQETGAESPSDLPGVGEVARDRGTMWNWGDPSGLPSSRRGTRISRVRNRVLLSGSPRGSIH
jgi:hypothetical protein